MIVRAHALPVVRQSRLVELSRSTAYYTPRAESEENLAAMKEIDRLYMGASHERIAHDQEPARGARAQDRHKPASFASCA